MDVYEAISKRRSVRAYRADAVPEDTLVRVLDAARRAPSGRNLQPWRFVVVRDDDVRQALANASPANAFLAEAPVVLAFLGSFANAEAASPQELIRGTWTWDMYVRYNVAIAAAYATLAATAEGLASCWINDYDEQAVRAVLRVPPTLALVCLMTLGYPAEDPRPKPRHPLNVLRATDYVDPQWR